MYLGKVGMEGVSRPVRAEGRAGTGIWGIFVRGEKRLGKYCMKKLMGIWD
jgi:hypothetical protein